jgi:hypothetical protein
MQAFRIQVMHRVLGSVLATLLALAVATTAWADCTGPQPNAHAQMKCCANRQHQCNKTGNPDDCCRQMRDAGPSALLATTAVPLVKVPVVHGVITLLAAPTTSVVATVTAPAVPEFKRPHDPPHLHPFALLI